jgi:hypothetical protein
MTRARRSTIPPTRKREVDIHRSPPHSVEAEQGVLGSMIDVHDGAKAMAEARDKITSEYFYVPRHRTIFNALCAMRDERSAIDLVTVTNWLRDAGLLDAVGGAAYVSELFRFVPCAANIEYYLEIISEKYQRRELIAACTETVRRAYAPKTESDQDKTLVDEHDERLAAIRALHSRNGAHGESFVRLVARNPEEFKRQTLLGGNRYLCRHGAMLVAAESGVGKSSLAVQWAIEWGLGLPSLGIKPARPLKILYVQAENDPGDLYEMARGVIDKLKLSDEQRKQIDANVVYVSERAASGAEFLTLLRKLLRKHKADLVFIDVLHAYAGGDVKDSEIMRAFLRNGLNPMLEQFDCAAVIFHHVPKPTNRDTKDWTANTWAYSLFGSSEITNWPRAILAIDSTKLHGLYRFIAAKRGSRIGWADAEGNPVIERYFKHHDKAIYWKDATDDEIELAAERQQKHKPAGAAEKKFTVATLYTLLDPPMLQRELKHLAMSKAKDRPAMSERTFYRLWDEAHRQRAFVKTGQKWQRNPNWIPQTQIEPHAE